MPHVKDKQNILLKEHSFNVLLLSDTGNLKCKMRFCWAINASWGTLYFICSFDVAGRHQSPRQNRETAPLF